MLVAPSLLLIVKSLLMYGTMINRHSLDLSSITFILSFSIEIFNAVQHCQISLGVDGIVNGFHGCGRFAATGVLRQSNLQSGTTDGFLFSFTDRAGDAHNLHHTRQVGGFQWQVCRECEGGPDHAIVRAGDANDGCACCLRAILHCVNSEWEIQ